MSLDLLLQQEIKGLPENALKEIIRYVRFMKIEMGGHYKNMNHTSTDSEHRVIRKAGKYRGQGWMSDDFDAPLEDFKEYM